MSTPFPKPSELVVCWDRFNWPLLYGEHRIIGDDPCDELDLRVAIWLLQEVRREKYERENSDRFTPIRYSTYYIPSHALEGDER